MNQKRVLIVDDSRTTVEILKVYLMGNDFEFRVSTSGPGAIETLRTWPADLVISDIKMPGMDGISLCAALKVLYRSRVIIMSSRLSEETRRKALRAGADGILSKPLEPAKLA
jgi:two-component system response regulator BaeR